jgi:hypothetical protein
VRALAQAACRALKIDPNPVLVRLPKVEVMPLGSIGPGINASFKGSAPARELSDGATPRRGLLILVLVLVLAALAMFLLPRNFFQWGRWPPRWRPCCPLRRWLRPRRRLPARGRTPSPRQPARGRAAAAPRLRRH